MTAGLLFNKLDCTLLGLRVRIWETSCEVREEKEGGLRDRAGGEGSRFKG